jgi:hypothetical protein
MHNNNSKKITPLSKFPTEVILHFYRKNRLCYTDHYKYVENYNHKTNKREFWIPFYGPFEKDGVIYNPICLGYTKSTGEECHKKFTKIMSIQDAHWDEDGYYYGYSEWQYGDEMNFRFEGMYWEGTIKQIKDELSKREHVGIFNNKDYRKWLIKYKKSMKG